MPHSATIGACIVGACLLGSAALLTAGPLNPPVGPVAPTYKTLSEVEPRIAINATNTPGDANSLYRITQPGSYYLTGNITGMASKHGIEIATDGVTIDLSGFSLTGGAGSLDGITIDGLRGAITVHNGVVAGWGNAGIDLVAPLGAGESARVTQVTLSGNTGIGVGLPGSSVITDCQVINSLTNGGISVGSGSTVANCSVYNNNGTGIFALDGCTITGCAVSFSAGDGINTFSGCTVSNCSVSENVEVGISVNGGGTVTGCTVFSNTIAGISCGTSSTVSNCTVIANIGDGILVESSCRVRANNCDYNGFGTSGDGANIYVAGTDTRVEENNCSNADRGIEVEFAGNFITRNTCSGNTTNWSVVAGNRCLVVSSAASGAVMGNAGGVSPGSSDPNANFTY